MQVLAKTFVPFKVRGKGGSVVVEILPAPRGLGLVAGGKIRRLLELAGLKDAYTTCKRIHTDNEFYGQSSTRMSKTDIQSGLM